jgi:hypothetical protein
MKKERFMESLSNILKRNRESISFYHSLVDVNLITMLAKIPSNRYIELKKKPRIF